VAHSIRGFHVFAAIAAVWTLHGCVGPGASHTWPAGELPALDSENLPGIPEQSPRNANYTIAARLHPERHEIEGALTLEWTNVSEQALDSFPFHLYWNAFRNNLSTSARGRGRRAARVALGALADRGWGYTEVTKIELLDDPATDLTATLEYIQPDDGNTEDRTVMQVHTERKIAAGETVRFRIEWRSRIPYGDVGRAGWVHDYHFIAQWFPKIGVFEPDGWNAHQFHAWTEFFADYGVYDVALTLPKGFVVGATGRLVSRDDNDDDTETFRFVQEDVHDFTWTASRRFLVRESRFEDEGYPPVDIRLLVQPEHDYLSDRYIEATKIALRSYGAWSAPYPYAQITVVDPAWGSASGGMEYPTIFTGGASLWSPAVLQSPEGVTVHEAGHQFWYGLIGNNEFEEAWLDEGFDSYHTSKALSVALGPSGWGRRYFGMSERGRRGGIPVIAPGVWIGRASGRLSGLRQLGTTDVMARRAWEYRVSGSYGLNSYGKPALSLQTLEGLVGDEMMTRILRTYSRRHRFGHPETQDFIDVVNEVSGRDYGWFFDQTWFSSELCDYAVEVAPREKPKPAGYREGTAGEPVLVASPTPETTEEEDGEKTYEVTVRRLGGVRLPVEIAVDFEDGQRRVEHWDGQDRWRRFEYEEKVVAARVDPDRKIALDVNPTNNHWVEEKGTARRGASKAALRFMLWLQTLLELHVVLM